jgi:MFS family permease
MTPLERRASLSLATLYALRMLGLFLILPVFAVHARSLPGGDDAARVGIALGIYGLTQGLLQLPFGIASDRLGRKPVIVFGLLLFAAGSFIAALGDDLPTVIVGRALQGSGAISAAVTAMIADCTRDSQRTKAMAMVGGSIGGTFALSLIVAPPLYAGIGVAGLFALTGVLALAGIGLVIRGVPSAAEVAALASSRSFMQPPAAGGLPVPGRARAPTGTPSFRSVLLQPDLLRLNFGIFALHAVQLSMFVVLPGWLIERGLPLPDHWQIYLPTVLLSFAVMMPPLNWGERRGRVRTVFLGSVALLVLVMIGVRLGAGRPSRHDRLAFRVLRSVQCAGGRAAGPGFPPGTGRGPRHGARRLQHHPGVGPVRRGSLGGWVHARWGGVTVFVLCALMLGAWLLLSLRQRQWASGSGGRGGAESAASSLKAH